MGVVCVGQGCFLYLLQERAEYGGRDNSLGVVGSAGVVARSHNGSGGLLGQSVEQLQRLTRKPVKADSREIQMIVLPGHKSHIGGMRFSFWLDLVFWGKVTLAFIGNIHTMSYGRCVLMFFGSTLGGVDGEARENGSC